MPTFDTVEKYWHPKDAKKKKNKRVVSELGLMQNCLSENAYFAHEEGVLISMLCDLDRPEFRQKAAETIIKIRGLRQEGAQVRNFAPPEVNWETATSYDKFISDADFEDPQHLNEPPLTMRWSDQEVWEVAEDPSLFTLRHVPVHSTAVEREIGLGTQLAANYQVGDGDEGERFEQEMANMKFSHQTVREFKSKQDYRPHLPPPSMPPPRQAFPGRPHLLVLHDPREQLLPSIWEGLKRTKRNVSCRGGTVLGQGLYRLGCWS